MKSEIIGMCPCCFDSKKSANVDIFVCRQDNGDISNMYIFGDDDFDVPAKNQAITEIKVSEDGKNITDIVCPRCKEHILVSIPVIKTLDKNLSRVTSRMIGKDSDFKPQFEQ